MLLTVLYTAPLPPGFQSGTVELKSKKVYIDAAGRVNQPYYLARLNAAGSLTDVQTGGPLVIVGMGGGDPVGAEPLDVTVDMVATNLPKPLSSTFRVVALTTGNSSLNLHAPPIRVPVIGPPEETLANLITQAQSNTQQLTAALSGANAALASANTAVTTANAANAQALTQVTRVDDALDLSSFVVAMIPPALDAVNAAAQNARDAAATLPCPPVVDVNARIAFFAALTGNGSCLQMDTLHVWQRLNGVVSDLGPNSKAIASGAVKAVSVTAGLASAQGLTNGDLFSARGAALEGDGGQGLWQWVEGPRPANDGVLHRWHATLTNGFFARIWDGVRANLAWAGLSAGAGAAAVTAALTVLAGSMIVSLDKTYTLEAAATVPANTRLFGRSGVGFVGDGSARTLLICQPGSSLHDVNLNGNVALTRNTSFTTQGLIVSQSTAANPVQLIGCKLSNAPDHGVYGFGAHGTRIQNLSIDGACSEAIYFQMSDHLFIDGVYGKNCQTDGVKIHSKDGQAANLYAELDGLTVQNVFMDYSNVTITGDTLAVEMWGGQTAFINNIVASNIHVISPAAISSGSFFGISADTCKGGSVRGFSVNSQGRQTITLGIEAAGCIDFTYDTGTVRGFKYIGASFSQPNTRNLKALNITFRDAATTGQTYAMQWFNGIKGGDVVGCTFKDAGDRYIFLNDCGDFVRIQGNHFYIGAQAADARAIYVSGAPRGVRLIDNEFGVMLWAGDVPSSTGIVKAAEIPGAQGWIIRGNTIDALRPDGSYGGSSISAYGGGGGHTIEGNIGYGHTAAFLGNYDAGPGTAFLYNKILGSTVSPQNARPVDFVVAASAVTDGAGPTYIILYKQSVTAATLRTGYPNKAVSTCALNDDTLHGFPTTKGTVKTDRTGWELTQYGQLAYDMQTWYAYDSDAIYQRRSNLDGSWAAWTRIDAGGVATAVPNPHLVSGVSGGTPGNAVIVRGGDARDLHPAMLREVRSSSALLVNGPDGRFYGPGATVPGYSGQTPGARVYLNQQNTDTATNLGIFQPGTSPAPIVGIPAVELGWFRDASTLIWLPQAPRETQDTSSYVTEDFWSYALGPMPAPFVSQWTAIGGGSNIVNGTTFASTKALQSGSSGDSEHLIARSDVYTVNGSVLMVGYLTGAAHKQMSVAARISGSAGTETAVSFELDNNAGQTRMVLWLNGVRTVLKVGGGNLAEGTHYALELSFFGTLLRGRYWDVTQPPPDWQVNTVSSALLASGRIGAGFRDGNFNLGTLACTTGTTTLSDVVRVNI